MAQSISAHQIRQRYGVSLFGSPNPLFKRCLRVSSTLGLAVLAAAYLAPKRVVEISSVDQVPDRFAKLILEEPQAPAAPPKVAPKPDPEIVMDTKPEPKPQPRAPVKGRPQKKIVPTSKGQAGRELAKKQVAAQLGEVKESLDKVLDGLSASLASSEEGTKKPQRRSRKRKTRSGRSASQMATMGSRVSTIDVPTSQSSISGAQIAIESIGDVTSENLDPESGTGSGMTGSEYRSNASLLAVVRRYAAGIQFCYDNELKKKPGLGGKLIVSITVTPSGQVSEAVLVRDTVGSSGLASCALAQIEAWKFPRIPEGTVTFQAPFIFTPPE